MNNFENILEQAIAGIRLSTEDAYELFSEADLPSLSYAANEICTQKHPKKEKTYVIDRNINYTNVCVSGCKFCAFYCGLDDVQAYLLNEDQILAKVGEAIDLGATQIMLQGGLHPDLEISYFENIFRKIKENYNITLHSLSAPEINHISKNSGLSVVDTLQRLANAGLDSLPGGGAEILADDVRNRVSPKKCSSQEWLSVMKEAASIGMKATATMVFGMGESIRDRISHLDKIRALQDSTAVFRAFIPWTFVPGNTQLGGIQTGGHDYLRTLAISRLYLDNIDNIQASWVTQGAQIAQLSLEFGANDFGSVMIEENVVAAAGVKNKIPEANIIEIINFAGYDAVQRNTEYQHLKRYPALIQNPS